MKKHLLYLFLVLGFATLNINSVSAATFTYAGSPYSVVTGATLTATPTVTGYNFIEGYAINKALPTGLTFSNTTGVISGTPTVVSPLTSYIVTLTYNFGINTVNTTVMITVNPGLAFTYTSPPAYTVGNAITPLSPTVTTGGPITSITGVTPALPVGLSISAAGVISGTPTLISGSTVYTVTAKNAGGSTGTASVTFIVNPPAPSLTYASGNVYTVGIPVSLTPTYGGSYVPTNCTISPALPAGLSISAAGVISGTPLTASALQTYTVIATNAGGSAPSNPFTITVNLPAPPIISYNPNSYTYTYGQPVSIPSPTNSGGIPTSYSINTPLPLGFIFSTTTGAITGTPNAILASTTYYVTATNAAGNSLVPAPIKITINPAPLTVTATGPLKPYGTVIPTGTSTTNFTYSGTITGQSVTSVTLTPDANGASATTPVGSTYVVTPSAATGTGGFLASNYNITYNPYNGTVDKPNLYITANNVSKVYGTVLTGGSGSTAFTSSGLLNGETIGSVTIAYGTGSAASAAVGTYNNSITASAATGGTFIASNYNIIYITGNITVNQANLTITATGPAKTYGQAVTTGSSTTNFTTSGLAPGETITSVTLTVAGAGTPAAAAAGTAYTVAPSNPMSTGVFTAANYNITYVTYNGTVAPAPLTITANNVSKVYGTQLSSYAGSTAFTPTGLQLGQTIGTVSIQYGPAAASSTAVGVYPNNIQPFSATGGTFTASNYVITYNATASITVTAEPLTVSADNKTITQGSAIPPLTITYTGFVNGDTPSSLSPQPVASTTATSSSPVGSYPITLSTGTNSNYSITFVQGTLTINPVAPAFTYPTPNNYSVGTPIPTLSPTISGGPVSGTASFGAGTIILTTAAGNGSLSNPDGMAVDPSGNVYVTNFGANTVTEYSSTGVITTFGTPYLSGPVGIVFDSMGNAYVLDKTSSNVVKFTAAPTFSYAGVIITTANGLSTPTGIAIDASDNIYIGNNGNNTITKYSTVGGNASLTFNTRSAAYPVSAGIAVDGSGNIYVVDNSGGTYVDSYSPTGTYITEVNTGGNGTVNSGIYIDGSGRFYLTTTTGKNASVYNSKTFGTPLVTETGFTSPRGIVTDNAGNLYVSDFTAGTVTKYPPLSGYYISGALPPGLSFNSTNGNITGTPTASFTGSYTVTGYNASGPGTSNTFTIHCVLNPPMIAYIPNSYTFAVNTAITPIDVTNTGGPVPATPGYGPGIVILSAANGLNHPWGVAIDPSGSVYAVNNAYTTTNGLSPITKWSGGAQVPFTLTPALASNNPIGVAFDSFGNAYILTPTNLYKYSSTGALVTSAVYTGIANGLGIAIDAGNNIFVSEGTASTTNTSNDHAIKFPTTGGAGNLLFTPSLPFGITGGIAVDSEDNLYPVDNLPAPSVDQYNQAGQLQGVFSFVNSSYGVAVDGANNVFIAGNGQIIVENSDATKIADIPNLTDPRAVVVDQQGDVFVSDYTNNTVTEYKPVSGYYLTGTLPPGLTFDNTTGEFAGTPTTIFPAVTLTVTAYNASGMSSTTITFTCGNANYWHGITAGNTDWNTAANWSAGSVPLATDVAYIGTTYGNTSRFQYLPTISAGESPTIAAVVMGSANKYNIAPGIIANGTGKLTVTTNITFQGDAYAENNYTATLSGTGTIKANSLIITTAYNDFESYQLTVNSSITSLQLTSASGSLSLVAGVDNTNDYSLPVFNVTGGVTSVAGTIQTSNVNNVPASISTITVKPVSPVVATLQLAASTALSGLSPYGTNILSFKNTGATIEYSGLNAQTVYTDVAITGLPTGPSYQNLKFSGTGIKTPNGTATNNLNVAGDFTNTLANDPADYVNLTSTIVNFNGTTQSLNGGAGPTYSATSSIAAPNPAGTVLYKVNFSGAGTKTMASGGFAVASTGVLTMSASGAILAAGGFLTLNSDANSSATIPVIPTGASITGKVNVQRWVTGGSGYRGYRLMSSPVNGTADSYPNNYSLNYLNNNTWIKGVSGIGFSGGAGTDNVFLYRENLAPSNATFTSGNYNGVNSMVTSVGTTPPAYSYPIDGNSGSATFSVPVGDGFLFFFRGDKLVAPLTTEAVSTYTPTSSITIATGTLNQGTIAVKDWYTSSSPYLGRTSATANAAVRGYNLVGNPYASTIDLTKASTTAGAGIQLSQITNAPSVYGVETNFYELNPATQNFDVWSNSLGTGTNNATQYIASGQGFFVVADTTNQTLTFNESAKVNAQNAGGSTLYMATGGGVTAQNIRAQRNPAMINNNGNADQHIRLKLAMDTINKDDIYINFDPSAKAKYTANEDATYKQGSGKVSFSSFSSDNISLAINSMPLPAVSEVIGLKVSATADGVYSLNMSELKNIPDMYDVWLMDAYKKDSLNMRKSASYSFNLAHADTNSFGSKRFTLVIRQNPALATRLLTFTAAKATNGAQMTWKTVNEQNNTNFTVQRSTDGGNTFSNLGALVSNSSGAYSFTDNNPVVPADSYRLQITDVNGNITYSNIVPLQYSNLSNNIAATVITIFPNPTVSLVNIAINQTFNTSSFDIQVVNSSGVVVKKATSTTPSWQSDVSRFIPGTYVIQVVKHSDQTVVGRGTFVKL